jgi:hypothetical protein
LKKASWIVLVVMGAAVVIVSLISTWVAYSGTAYTVGSTPVAEIAAAHEGAGPALRGIRGTSAAYGAAYGILFLAIVLGPYRRGEVWAWWAILGSALALAAIAALRIPTLGVTLGIQAPLIVLGVVVLGLLLDFSRLRASSERP